MYLGIAFCRLRELGRLHGDDGRERHHSGVSQNQLAQRMGPTAASVSRWEAGKRPIPEMAARFLTLLVEVESRKGTR